nr:zinc finger, CCHC-type, retrotransposon Gag domain protein [Tanacetum cinerariifolium]
MIQVCLNATVRNNMTDNGIEFVNQTLRTYYEEFEISHKTSIAHTLQQNGIVERQNRTLVKAARTMFLRTTTFLLLCPVSFSKDLTCENWMVNARTDADLSAAVQNALQTLLPQIRVKIREEFRTSSGPSDAGGNPPPVTIHAWLERFNKQKPHSFEKATAPIAKRGVTITSSSINGFDNSLPVSVCPGKAKSFLLVRLGELMTVYGVSDQAKDGPTNYALMAYSTLSASSTDSEVSDCSKSCLKAVEN